MEPTIKERITTQRRAVLSSLWIFVLLNMLFRDIHEFGRPGAIEEMMAQDVPEWLLLAAGIVLTAFISMIVLSRLLPRRTARLANMVVGVVAIAGMAGNPPRDLDDLWFAAVEVAALLAIIGLSWTWRSDDEIGIGVGQLSVSAP
jgi:hypothetical protein